MAIASLSKLSVPLPPGQSSSSQGLLMPKLKYRFRVLLENFGVSKPTTEMTKQVVSVGRPNVTFEQVELHVYNSKVKYAGKHSWEDISLVVRDDVTGAVSKLVGEQLQKQFDFFEQSSASSGIDYKFTTKIELLDGGNGAYEPQVLETFELLGCYVKQAQYQQGDYSSNDAMDITLSIAYDNAIQTDTAGNPVGIGTAIGRTLGTLATGG
jgi:hypothetical protein